MNADSETERIPLFNGREVKTTGDGFLVEFPSALQATQCAVEIQRAVVARNATQPGERHIQVRIGIHVGDVVHREADMYGDGVNIAARIEPLAIGGGICLSDTVYAQVRNKLDVGLTKLDSPELKHIEVPMDVYRVVLPWDKTSSSRRKESPFKDRSQSLVTSATRWGWIAALVLLVVGASWWFVHQSGKATNQLASPPAAPGAASAADQKSIAVLPFVNMSADKADEYLSDGMTEELLNVLAKVPGLRVPGRSSSFAFKGKIEEGIFRKVGEQLHVSTVLEGSVRKAGNQLRINAQLINVADGFQLWSETYDRELSDIFAIQSDIAQQVAAALKIRLGVEETKNMAKRPTENLEAFDLYLRGRAQADQLTEAGFKRAIALFDLAIEKDPRYALAYAGKAEAYFIVNSWFLPPDEARSLSEGSAKKAIDLDGLLPEAHVAMGLAKTFAFEWDTAEKEFQIALKLNSGSAPVHLWYGVHLCMRGRFGAAIEQLQEAGKLDPLSAFVIQNLGWVYFFQGRYDLAIVENQRSLEYDPNFYAAYEFVGWSYAQQTNYPAAFQALRKAVSLSSRHSEVLGVMGYTYGLSGNPDQARALVVELTERARTNYVSPAYLAFIHVGLGELEEAIQLLEQGATKHDANVAVFLNSPCYERLRADARYRSRFTTVIKQVGL